MVELKGEDHVYVANDPATWRNREAVVHSHKPSIETRNDVLYINPGSAGPRRFRLPVTVARMRISGLKIEPEIVELQL